jgi:hypothetical protein
MPSVLRRGWSHGKEWFDVSACCVETRRSSREGPQRPFFADGSGGPRRTKPSGFITALSSIGRPGATRWTARWCRVTPEMERRAEIFWSDLHFLMIAVKHLEGVLQMMSPNAPRLNRAFSANAVELRHLLEH